MSEEWRPCGFGYLVSNLGRVKRDAPGSRPLSASDNGRGYLKVDLFANGKRVRRFRVSRLVAEAFIPNPFGLGQVNHLDGNKRNNSANNLQWCSASENVRHAIESGLWSPENGGRKGAPKVSASDVSEIRRLSLSVPIRELASRFGLSRTQTVKIATRVAWRHIA